MQPEQQARVVHDYEDDEIDLRELLNTLLQHKKLGISVFAAVLFCGLVYLFVATPIYTSDALIQIEEQSSPIPGMNELAEAFGEGKSPAQTQIEILHSRSVLGRVVRDLQLNLQTQPQYFPKLGKAMVRRETTFLAPMFSSYAWADEALDIGRLEVPEAWLGRPLQLRTEQDDGFTLFGPEDEVLLTGRVGEALSVETNEGSLSIFVRSIVAKPGVRFTVVLQREPVVIAGIKSRLSIEEKGKQTGIIELSLQDADPHKATRILASIINNYVRQNVEQRSEQASKSLEFLDKQLPGLKQKVMDAEAALQSYKASRGSSVDLSVQGKAILDQASELETRLSALQLQRTELRSRFTETSPAIRTIDQQIAQLKAAKSKIESQFEGMPETELEILRLLRDVEVANELYLQLLNSAQEFKVAKAATVGDARILDTPIQPWEPSKPKRLLVLALTVILAGMLGVLAIFLRMFLTNTLETPDAIEKSLGLSVFATIPESATEKKTRQAVLKGQSQGLLCQVAPQDPAVESLRSLRTSLQFALLQAKNNVVAIHGPTPGIGKSFVSSNLAFLMAEVGKNVLLIDADLRKGHTHKLLGKPRSPGLSEVLSGSAQAGDVLHRYADGRINFLSTGQIPPNPADLLMHERFDTLLTKASENFDLVIVDTPPTLNLADSISIAKLTGVNFIVCRAGVNTLQDLQVARQRMEQNAIRIDGVVFNGLSASASKYKYGGYYSYKYQ